MLSELCMALPPVLGLEPKLAVNEHDFGLHSVHGAPQDRQCIADALITAAVMTFPVDLTWGLLTEAGAIFHRRLVAGALERRIEVRGDLIGSGDDPDLFVPEESTGQTVACAVDIENLAFFADGIRAG